MAVEHEIENTENLSKQVAQGDDEDGEKPQNPAPQNIEPSSEALVKGNDEDDDGGDGGDDDDDDIAAFDMRSIHDHPPTTRNHHVDAAWDTSKNDVFDEATQVPSLSNVVVLKPQAFSPSEEKKSDDADNNAAPLPDDWESVGPGFGAGGTGNDNDVDADETNEASNETNEASNDIPAEAFSHLSLADLEGASEPIVPMEDALNGMEKFPDDEAGTIQLHRDDEPLFGAISRSGVPKDESLNFNNLPTDVEKRIEMYSNIERDENSSVDSEDSNDDDASDNNNNCKQEEIAYAEQNSDDEDYADLPRQPANSEHEDAQANSESDETASRKDVPTFEPAIVAAENADNADASESAPAPETSASPENATANDGEGPKKKIPLIAPPPAEKLHKWNESKTRGQKYLAAKKGESETAASPEKKGSPVSTPTSQSSVSRFSSPEKLRSPGENKRMAEKIAFASSAAAVTFAEQYQQPETIVETPEAEDKRRSSYVQQSDNLLCGAFTWESTEDSCGQDSISKSVKRNSQRDFFDEHSKQKISHWFLERVLTIKKSTGSDAKSLSMRSHLEENAKFNKMCQYLADCVNGVTAELGMAPSMDASSQWDLSKAPVNSRSGDESESIGDTGGLKRPWLKPMTLTDTAWNTTSGTVAAANFVNFLFLAAKLSKRPSPFGDRNPFIDDLVTNSLSGTEVGNGLTGNLSPQQLIFEHPRGHVEDIVQFVYVVSLSCESQREKSALRKLKKSLASAELGIPPRSRSDLAAGLLGRTKNAKKSRLHIVPEGHPSPFEASVWNSPRMLAAFLSFLGDPVAVCRMKMVNRFCYRIISENQHVIMKDAVRIGGLSMNVRPTFWMWITLQQFADRHSLPNGVGRKDQKACEDELRGLAEKGRGGKWQHIIERDVMRSFGNMPPHKTVARLQDDSIVRALVTWGQNRIMARGVKGGGEPVPIPKLGPKDQRKSIGKPPRNSASGTTSSPPWLCSGNFDYDEDALRIDTAVSEWSGVSPVPSFTGSHAESLERTNSRQFSDTGQLLPLDELALGGNCLTDDMKENLQDKLRLVLHSLAAAYEGVGYCQGMDYVVAHLLRILQDTVMWKASKGSLPAVIGTAPRMKRTSNMEFRDHQQMFRKVESSLVVEEVIFKVMDVLFTNYSLQHMYWPELRCLKTFCRVFERLIQIKLPVLADHFEHHDLNVGLFALGWFQTLFLYLPSMPSATVCHMWDIWLVERSFKIFFRVGTAILFLSQPTLLNNELEGMMTYLNTFPDATLLKPDILIPCSLNIKVTNSLLQNLEAEVTASG